MYVDSLKKGKERACLKTMLTELHRLIKVQSISKINPKLTKVVSARASLPTGPLAMRHWYSALIPPPCCTSCTSIHS